MNIYLISQTETGGYETYDSAVVIAESEEEARNTSPHTGLQITAEEWPEQMYDWCSSSEAVSVTLIGTAEATADKGVVCASFNAG